MDTGWKTPSESGYPDPPVPANEVLYYNGAKVVSISGEAFYWLSNHWVSKGFIPGGVTPVLGTTWGAVKAKYKK